jgi:hypothetical protein
MKTYDLELRAFKHTVESTEDVQSLFEELDSLSGTELKELHNSIHNALGSPDKAVKKFSDKKTAIRRTNLALDDLERTIAEEGGGDAQQGQTDAAPEAEEQAEDQGGSPQQHDAQAVQEKDASEGTQEATPKTGRRSKHANARLVVRNEDFNPHRQGTKSHATYKMIRNNPGITYQEAIDAGARRNTLNFDLRLGHIIYQEVEQ